MQVAIAAIISGAATSAKVIPRNILNELGSGNFAMVEVGGVVDGWFVSMDELKLVEKGQNYAVFNYGFAVWQVRGYQTGNNTSNSEKSFLDEMDLVVAAFMAVDVSDAFLSRLDPPSFYESGLFPRTGANGMPIHINKGRCWARGVKVGC